MPVYFSNAGAIDLDMIRISGISVKTGTNPIGWFGTGLKFAIATLLRTGHSVELIRLGESFKFSVQSKQVRGESFEVVMMNDEALSFTTQLGRNWEVWQAYRELHSNTLDENGTIGDTFVADDTVFKITGDEFQRQFIDRHEIFVPGEPCMASECGGLEAYPGSSRTIFYRGVRAGNLPEPTMFTYNILDPMTLSEDRLFRSQWDVEYKLRNLIPRFKDKGRVTMLISQTTTFDGNLDFETCNSPSLEFLEAAKTQSSNAGANPSIHKIVERDMQETGTFPPVNADEIPAEKLDTLNAAIEICCTKLGTTIEPGEVLLCSTLGVGTMGIYHIAKDQIFLSLETIERGLEFTVAVLFEEWCHKVHKFEDESREFQSFLLHKLVSTAMGEK